MERRYFVVRRVVIALLVALLLGGSIAVIIDRLNTFAVLVSTDPSADIYAAVEPEGEFENIGQGSASFSTKQQTPIYFKVVKGEQESLLAVSAKALDGQTVEIALLEPLSAQKFLEGPIVDPMIEKDLIYGISANTNSIFNVGISEFKPPKLSYVGLPFLKEIVWQDSNNFVYERYSGGVGAFINGDIIGSAHFGSGTNSDSAGRFYALAKHGEQPLALLGDDGIYTSSNLGKTNKRVYQTAVDEAWYLNADDDYIYYASYKLPTHHATETEDVDLADLHEDDLPSVHIYVLDYEGGLVVDTVLQNTARVYDIARVGDSQQFVILGDKSAVVIAPQNQSEASHSDYFLSSVNMLSVGDNLFVFNQFGIWRMEPATGLRQLVFKFIASQNYVPGSAEVTASGNLQFTATSTSSSGAGGVYQFEL